MDELDEHIADIHKCPQCKMHGFGERGRDIHLQEIHGLKWHVPEGIKITEDLVLDIPGWRTRKDPDRRDWMHVPTWAMRSGVKPVRRAALLSSIERKD